MTNEDLLKENGWTIECESPFEIRHEDGSFASMSAAHSVVEGLRLGAVSGSLRDNLINHYNALLTKNHKYQMGDDDYGLSTSELTICRALTVILNDLKIRTNDK